MHFGDVSDDCLRQHDVQMGVAKFFIVSVEVCLQTTACLMQGLHRLQLNLQGEGVDALKI